MRIARYRAGSEIGHALITGDRLIPIYDPLEKRGGAEPLSTIERTGDDPIELADTTLLSPCRPSKVVAVGVNYAAHAKEMGRGDPPSEPMIFLKAPTAVIGPGETIKRPPDSERVDYEGELAVVIGRRCRHVPEERAASVIFGYTCLNDVTARDLQRRDVQFTRGKGFDTFCPLGPWIETELDVSDLAVETSVNGVTVQSGRTIDLIHSVPKLVAFISRVMTLLPGDVIATGTPEGVGPLLAGDKVSVRVEGIGDLTNAVEDEKI